MIGAIAGDAIGAPYEFNQNNIKTTDFQLFSERTMITDDSVMTCAVAEALFYAGNSIHIIMLKHEIFLNTFL